MLHRHLDLDPRAGSEVRRPQMGERQRLLEERRPAAAGRVTDLPAVIMDGCARAPRDGGELGRQAMRRKETLEGIPLDLEAHETPGRALLPLDTQRPAAVERALGGAHRPAQVDLE